MKSEFPDKKFGYCVYIDTVSDGRIPAVYDENGHPFVFSTETEAQREIADNMITRLQEFIDGERAFEDALTAEEYVAAVELLADGSIIEVQ